MPLPEGFQWEEDNLPSPTPTPFTVYSLGKNVGGPDEIQDSNTNKGLSAKGPNLTPGIVAVNPKIYPLGSILQDADTGYVYLASDVHGNKNPNVVDFFEDTNTYKPRSGTRNLRVIGRADKIPTNPTGVRELLSKYGKVPEGQSAEEFLSAQKKSPEPVIAGLPEGFQWEEEPAATATATLPEGFQWEEVSPSTPESNQEIIVNNNPEVSATGFNIVQPSQVTPRPLAPGESRPTSIESQPVAKEDYGPLGNLLSGIQEGLMTSGMRTVGGGAEILGFDQFGKELTEDADKYIKTLGTEGNLGSVGRGIGTGLSLMTGGLPSAVSQAGAQAFGQTYAQTGSYKEAAISALKTAPEMAAYWLIGAGASKALSPILKQSGPIVKAGAGALSSSLANMLTSAGIRTIEGQPLEPTVEGTTQDILFGVMHGLGTGYQASKSEAQAREGLKEMPTPWLETAAADPEFRKNSPFRQTLVDEEIARRKGEQPGIISNDPQIAATQAEINQKVGEIAPSPNIPESPLQREFQRQQEAIPETARPEVNQADIETKRGELSQAIEQTRGEGELASQLKQSYLTNLEPLAPIMSAEGVKVEPHPERVSDFGIRYDEQGNISLLVPHAEEFLRKSASERETLDQIEKVIPAKVDEEAFHISNLVGWRNEWKATGEPDFQEFVSRKQEQIANDLRATSSNEEVQTIIDAYTKGKGEKLSDPKLAMEFVRQVGQRARTGKTTEDVQILSQAERNGDKPAGGVLRHLLDTLDKFRAVIGKYLNPENAPQSLQDALETTNKVLDQYGLLKQKEGDLNAIQEQSAESIPVRYSPEDSQGVRQENEINQETAKQGEAPAKEVADDVLQDWTSATEGQATPSDKPPVEQKYTPMGITPFPKLHSAFEQIGKVSKAIWNYTRALPKQSDFKTSLLDWSANNQKSTFEINKVQREIVRSIPNETRRAGITNWIQAGGDIAELQKRAAASTNLKLKQGYEAAMNLTPDEIAIANKVRGTYDLLLKRGQKYGLNISELDNYVNQIWKQPPSDFITSSSRKLSDYFRFSKNRHYGSFFEGEQAGLEPQTKDISKLLPIYMNELNNAINSRRFVEQMGEGKMEDGRPILAPRGGITEAANPSGKAYLVFPDKTSEVSKDYKVLDQPALHDWLWRGKDEAGNPIYVKSDLAVHPKAYGHLKNVLGNSVFREWWNTQSENPAMNIGKKTAKFLLDDLQSYAKGTMLSLSPFHQVQEGIHGFGHKINPFSVPKIDLNNPAQIEATKSGLMLQPDRLSQKQFTEGLGSGDKNLVTAGLRKFGGKPGEQTAKAIDSYTHWLFENYIPGLKFKTYEAMVARNTERFKAQLASGEATPEQIRNLSAQQANAAYGHLNYAEMGRNPTMQHIAQSLLLAPDFLEARTRFALQAGKGLVSKSGAEQLQALGLLAVTQFVAARIANKLDHDDYEWEHPFEFRHGNKWYGVRSVPEDIYKLASDPRRFTYGRLSPLFGRGIVEGLSGVNYRGEPTKFGETLTNMIAGVVPLPLQSLTRNFTKSTASNPISPFEQVLSSTGIVIHRFSPITETYTKAHKWVEQHGSEYGIDTRKGTYPQSKYTQLRYALEDGDYDKAKEEIKKLEEGGMDRKAISRGFELSVNHHFTGSKKGDEAFYQSLNAHDKKLYNAALERRKVMLQRFKQAR